LLSTLDGARGALARGQPVIAWIPLDLRPSRRVPTRLATGKVVELVVAEHAVTLYGYAGDRVLALDPRRGAARAFGAAAFAAGMRLFDDLALAIGPAS
jgi:uncharacterized protein YvpB